MPESFDPYHRWLGIPPKQQPANHYRLFGLEPYESDPEVIRDAAERQMGHVRQYALGQHATESQQMLNHLGRVRACLLDVDKKQAYDNELRRQSEKSQPAPMSPPAAPSVVLPTIQAEPSGSRRATKSKQFLLLISIGAGVLLSLILFVTLLRTLNRSPSPDGTADRNVTVVEEVENPEEVVRKSAEEEYINSLDMKFRLIPGSPKSYYLGIHEVTQGQWESLMGTTPWKGQRHVKEGPDYPASYVSWEDAQEFVRKLSPEKGWSYRLPTEAEWEYACRAGTSTAYSFGDDASALGDYAWYDENTNDIGEKYAHRVGRKKPNGWGLYDMHGNVREWCEDPMGPSSARRDSSRVNRGGSWGLNARNCRSANRNGLSPDVRSSALGFRVALVPAD